MEIPFIITMASGCLLMLIGGFVAVFGSRNWQLEKARSTILSGICLVVLSFIANAAYSYWNQGLEVSHTETRPVLQIDYSEQTEGSYSNTFLYGRGRIEGVEYYVMYEKQEDGSVLFSKYPCEEVPLYLELDEGETAYIEYDVLNNGLKTNYRLYLPENAIAQRYDLNLDN